MIALSQVAFVSEIQERLSRRYLELVQNSTFIHHDQDEIAVLMELKFIPIETNPRIQVRIETEQTGAAITIWLGALSADIMVGNIAKGEIHFVFNDMLKSYEDALAQIDNSLKLIK